MRSSSTERTVALWRPSKLYEGMGVASPFMVVPLVVTAGLSILFCIWPNGLVHLFDLATLITRGVFGGAV